MIRSALQQTKGQVGCFLRFEPAYKHVRIGATILLATIMAVGALLQLIDCQEMGSMHSILSPLHFKMVHTVL